VTGPDGICRAVLLALLLGALAGCLDLGTNAWTVDAGAAPGRPPQSLGPGSSAGLPCPGEQGEGREVRVAMAATTFRPSEVSICVGDTVTWVNQDTKEHTVYTGRPEDPDGRVQSPRLYVGDTFSWTFSEPGEYVYYCSTHKKKMRDAWVLVR